MCFQVIIRKKSGGNYLYIYSEFYAMARIVMDRHGRWNGFLFKVSFKENVTQCTSCKLVLKFYQAHRARI